MALPENLYFLKNSLADKISLQRLIKHDLRDAFKLGFDCINIFLENIDKQKFLQSEERESFIRLNLAHRKILNMLNAAQKEVFVTLMADFLFRRCYALLSGITLPENEQILMPEVRKKISLVQNLITPNVLRRIIKDNFMQLHSHEPEEQNYLKYVANGITQYYLMIWQKITLRESIGEMSIKDTSPIDLLLPDPKSPLPVVTFV